MFFNQFFNTIHYESYYFFTKYIRITNFHPFTNPSVNAFTNQKRKTCLSFVRSLQYKYLTSKGFVRNDLYN